MMKKQSPLFKMNAKVLFFLLFSVTASISLKAQTNTFPPNGNVGIGTSNPAATLDVNGNIKHTGNSIFNVLNYQTADKPSWIKLGTIILPQQGNNASIKIYAGAGYNASVDQQGYIELHIRTSNTVSLNADGYPFSAYASSQGRAKFIEQIRIVPAVPGTFCNTFSVFIYCRMFIGNGFYTVESSEGTWTPVNAATGDPGAAYIVPFENVINNPVYMVQNVAIGTYDSKGYKLAVAGPMIAESVKVQLQTNWPDYVFAPQHQLFELPDLEKYIKKNKHLPEIPSASDVKDKGIDLGEMNAALLKKVEELTLYIIEQNKKLENEARRNDEQQERLKKLEGLHGGK